jgi:signal transduction histidine kinase/Spy/CpxP family protein refolding chaperone
VYSFRSKIVVWHLVLAAGAGVVVAALAGWLFFAGISWSARQSLSAAARVVPDLVALYEARDGSLAQAAPSISAHFRKTGIMAFVLVGDPSTGMRPIGGFFGPPGAQPGTRMLGDPAARGPGGPPRWNMLEALFVNVPPERVSVNGGIVVLNVDPGRYRLQFASFGLAAAGIFILILGTALFVAFSTARHVLEPLIRTTEALERFGDGHFTPEPVRTDDRSELGNLARAYNRAVAEITRAFEERLQTEAEMRQFVADAGHQLRTPLTVIMGHLSAFSFRPNDARSTAAFDNMLQESRRMRELIEDLIVLAKLEERDDRGEVTDVADVAHRLVDGYSLALKSRRVRLVAVEDATVAGREGEMYGALDALIDNALKYGNDTAVEVSVFREAGDAVITIGDRGPGLPAADLEHAFDRFYRGQTGEGVEGSGLGLSIVARVVERAGGRVSLRGRAGGGLAAEVRLPRIEAESKTSEIPKSAPSYRTDIERAQSRKGGSMSSISGIFGSSAASLSTSVNNALATTANSAAAPFNNLFASLDLTSTQQSKINQILKSAQSQGLTPAQVQAQINAVLTPSQLATLQSGLASNQPPQSGDFSNLDLSAGQQTKIQQILQSAKSQGLSQSQVQAQINAVLTPTQQATLQQDLKGGRHHGHHNGASSASVANDGTDEFGIPTTLASASTTSAATISNIAASYSVQSQYQDTD